MDNKDLKEKVKNFLPEIKKLIFGEDRKFKDAKMKDGTIIRYDGETPAQGMPLFVVTEGGEIAAPTGDYLMEDGAVIMAIDGVITEVKPAAPESAPKPEEMQESEEDRIKKVIETKVKEQYFSLEEKITALETKNTELAGKLEAYKMASEKTVTLLEEFSAAPSETPTEKPSSQPNFKLSEFAKSIKSARKEFKNL